MSSRWRQTTPDELAAWLVDIHVSWGIAGGWALDLWTGQTSREHSDIEIACIRADLPVLLPALSRFEIAVARNKVLTPYCPGGTLPDPPYSLWLRRYAETLWDFEIVAESEVGGAWAYRRDLSVRHPSSSIFRAAGGFPIIAPEIQLLYKTRDPRPKDIEDLRRFVPRLDEPDRLWLRSAVATAHPEFLSTFDDIAARRAFNESDTR